MSLYTHERPNSWLIRKTLTSVPTTHTRVIRARLDTVGNFVIGAYKPTDLIGLAPQLTGGSGPTIPFLRANHPSLDGTILGDITVTEVDGHPACWDFTLRYTHSGGGGGRWPAGRNRFKARVSSVQERVFVDRNGDPIGQPFFQKFETQLQDGTFSLRRVAGDNPELVDPDADVGAMRRGNQLSIDVVFEKHQIFQNEWLLLNNAVHGDPNDPPPGTPTDPPGQPPLFLGAFGAGEAQYIGGTFEEALDPNTGLPYAPRQVTGTLHFLAARRTISFKDGQGNTTTLFNSLNVVPDIGWKKVQFNDGRWARVPDSLSLKPVQAVYNLNDLLPLEDP